MKLRNDATRGEEREAISRAIGRMTDALDGAAAPGELPFKVELSAERRDALLSQARSYNATGLPISAALLLMASRDPDACEVARSREYCEAHELIEARHMVAAMATHHVTWQHENPKGQWQRLNDSGLNGAQISYIREAPKDGECYDLSALAKMLRRARFHGDDAARRHISAAYIGLLLLAQAPETRLLNVMWLRATLNIDVLHKVVRLHMNSCLTGLRFSGGFRGARAGIFNVRYELPQKRMALTPVLTAKQKRQLVARGAHRTSSTYIHLSAAHIEELARFVGVSSAAQGQGGLL